MNCKELGYKVGDEFEVVEPHQFTKGTIVRLVKYIDEGSSIFDVVSGSSQHARNINIYDAFSNLKPLEKTMDIKEAYKVMAQNCGIKVGDTVKVLRKAKFNEMGWNDSWIDTEIGKEQKVTDTYEGKFQLSGNWYPFFVLEKIKDGIGPIELQDYIVQFKEGGTIEIGRHTIDFETVKKIYDRAKSTL